MRITTLRTRRGDVGRLDVTWEDGHESEFPFVLLRHTVFFGAAPGGIPTHTGVRLPDERATLVLMDAKPTVDHLQLTWQDGETTSFRLDELRAMCPCPADRAGRRHIPALWDAEGAASRPWFEADQLADPSAELALLRELLDRGIAKVRGLSGTVADFERLVATFGPIHETGYGRIFDVRTDSQLDLGANTAHALGPHTDENYRHAPPGVSVFECVVPHPDGGASTYVDGFHAAARLKAANPEAFEVLATAVVDFAERSPGNDYRATGTVISLDRDGEVGGIRYTDRTITPPDLPIGQIEAWYDAMRTLGEIVNDPPMTYHLPVGAGEAVIFDNQRVLHGRTAFDPEAAPRHLRQAAVDRDEFHNRFRLLAAEAGDPAAELHFAPGARH